MLSNHISRLQCHPSQGQEAGIHKELRKFLPSTSCARLKRSLTTEKERETKNSYEKEKATPTKKRICNKKRKRES